MIDDEAIARLELQLGRLLFAGVTSAAICLALGLALWMARVSPDAANILLTTGRPASRRRRLPRVSLSVAPSTKWGCSRQDPPRALHLAETLHYAGVLDASSNASGLDGMAACDTSASTALIRSFAERRIFSSSPAMRCAWRTTVARSRCSPGSG